MPPRPLVGAAAASRIADLSEPGWGRDFMTYESSTHSTTLHSCLYGPAASLLLVLLRSNQAKHVSLQAHLAMDLGFLDNRNSKHASKPKPGKALHTSLRQMPW